MRRPKRLEPEEDFQMAPMIDMVFLLLVFFMCVSTLSQAEKTVDLDLPESEEAKVPEDLADRGTVSIAYNESEGTAQLYVGASAMDLEKLKATIKVVLQKKPETRVVVRADTGVPFREIKKVLKACAEVGAFEVIYSAYEG